MKNFGKVLICCAALALGTLSVQAKEAYINNLRTNFLKNSTIIYEINMRTFNAQDLDKDGIIEFEEGEESGNFLNAIARLDELQANGITALHVLPVTPVGKMKAMGTAGSLYAISSFDTLNPQIVSDKTVLTAEEQAKKFIREAHDRGIAVIFDVPACGSYDLYLQRPELFVKDKNGQPVVPADWTDVRLFDSGNETKINPDVLKVYKEYVDMVMELGVDGIRVDVAHSKPAKFWKELIDYSRQKDPQILWLAESSDSWKDSISPYTVYTPYDKLLAAGFDGYYGSYFNLKNWTEGKQLISHVQLNQGLEKKIGSPKSAIASFTTHDELSPIIVNGRAYSEMIMWLNATLPVNSYFVDGFDTGDRYIYFWANKKAPKTYTDDDYYFVHRGKIDIFNFSRKPAGNDLELQKEFKSVNEFKAFVATLYKKGAKWKPAKVNNPSVFAYTISADNTTVLVIGNLNFKGDSKAEVFLPRFNPNADVISIQFQNAPIAAKGKMKADLNAGEIEVFVINNYQIK